MNMPPDTTKKRRSTMGVGAMKKQRIMPSLRTATTYTPLSKQRKPQSTTSKRMGPSRNSLHMRNG